jgi:hypothetical protein
VDAKRLVREVAYSLDKFSQTYVVRARFDDLLELRPTSGSTVTQEDQAQQELQVINLGTCADLHIHGKGSQQLLQNLLTSESASRLAGTSLGAVGRRNKQFSCRIFPLHGTSFTQRLWIYWASVACESVEGK